MRIVILVHINLSYSMVLREWDLDQWVIFDRWGWEKCLEHWVQSERSLGIEWSCFLKRSWRDVWVILDVSHICHRLPLHKRISLFPPYLRMYLPFIGATKGYVASRLKAVIFYLNCGNRDRPYFRGLELIVISDSHALSTNYVWGTMLRGYDTFKTIAAQ